MSEVKNNEVEVVSKNFIEEAIEEDLDWGEGGKKKSVHTRFPPEPNGYSHIGHAKAICINFEMAKKYNGKCNLRMDDTNPADESMEYVESFKEDISWLGYEWDEFFYASDSYDKMYEYACILINKGLAYIDEGDSEEIRSNRGTLTESGVNSPYRDRPISENLTIFESMKNGELADGACVLRAKIDMSSPNMNMRDPVIYRVLRENHYRTGDEWCIYPMYDFAHPIEDANEGITHSLCSLEFEDHRPLYNWFIDNIGLWKNKEPRQMEFARLNMTRTIMSKRYLKKLVDADKVSGWDDPRMPTISGLRRRGYTPESIRTFCDMIGVSKSNSEVDTAMLEFCIREDLSDKAVRMMAIIDPLKVTIKNWPEDKFEDFEMDIMPGNPDAGKRTVRFGRTMYIERDDFMEDPPKKYFRLKPDGEVRLRGTYIIKYESVIKDGDGNILEVVCTYDPESKSGKDARKVKGTLHWVNADDAVDAEFRLYDYLLLPEEESNKDQDYMERLNPDSLITSYGYIEPELSKAKAGDTFQFMRIGYFCMDKDSENQNRPIFNKTIGLRDSWSKTQKK